MYLLLAAVGMCLLVSTFHCSGVQDVVMFLCAEPEVMDREDFFEERVLQVHRKFKGPQQVSLLSF